MNKLFPNLGAPHKCTAERIETIARNLRAGVSRHAAAARGGITYNTFLRWEERGMVQANALEEGLIDEIPEDEMPFYLFFMEISVAEGDVEAEQVEQWRSHTEDDWQANKEYLARRFPSRWGGGKAATERNGDEEGKPASGPVTNVQIYIPSNSRD